MRDKKVLLTTQAAMIAALYVVLTLLANALTILPFFTPAAIPGLTAGCILSNLLTGCMPLDIIFGSLATFLGAVGTYMLRKHMWAAPIPPIAANTIIV